MPTPTDLIPGTSLTHAEEAYLIRLLAKVKAVGYLPERTFRAINEVVSCWATELVITRDGIHFPFPEILLAIYEGGEETFQGMWHIPGGYGRIDQESVQGCCTSVALREIRVDVICASVIHAYMWQPEEHPHGRPLSLFVRCDPVSEVEETDRIKFFPVNALPEPMIPCHRDFIIEFL